MAATLLGSGSLARACVIAESTHLPPSSGCDWSVAPPLWPEPPSVSCVLLSETGQAENHPGRKGWVRSRTPMSGTALCWGNRLHQTRCIPEACMASSTLPPRRPGFRFRSLRPERARLQRPRRGSVPCSRFSYARVEAAQRASCLFACRSTPPLFDVGNVFRSPRAVALCPSPIHLPDGRTVGCLCALHGRSGWEKLNHQARLLDTPAKSECWYVLVQAVRTVQALLSFAERR